MAIDYLPLLILLIVAIGIGAVAIILPHLLGPYRKNPQKLEPYESGIIPFHDARRRFPVKYYLVAMLFILFDIETVFLVPWALDFHSSLTDGRAWFALSIGLSFLFILTLGLVYEWRKGLLEWNR